MLLQLLESASRAFALGGAVWLGLWLLRVHHPQARMTAWTVVLMVSLAMPALMRWTTVTIPGGSAPPATTIDQPSAVWRLSTEPVEFSPGTADSSPSSEQPDVDRHASAAFADPRFSATDWPAIAMGLYLAVAGGLLLGLMIGLAITWRLLSRSKRIVENWTTGLDVRASAGIATPVTFGATILLPAEWPDWSPTKRQAVLAHERSHVTRGDFLVLLLATWHRALFWFSPFSWWLLKELAETAELVSDDAAIDLLGDHLSYAEILLDVARSACNGANT
jgi:bla regulator protein blaR1